MDRTEIERVAAWKARFKARFESRMGLECGPEFLESAMLFNGIEDSPEDCADDEIKLWGEEYD